MSDAESTPVESTETETHVEANETDWKAEARKWEARAKANKEASDKLAELEEAQKTEHQKLTERAEAAERELEQSRYESLRLSVIARNEVPEKYQHLVRGADESELTEAAKAVSELVSASAAPKTGGRVVVDDLDAGNAALNGTELEDALRRSLGIN